MNTVVTSKEDILKACRQLAASQDISSLNMRAVAKACGVSVGSIYNYFPSKTDLITAAIADIWKNIFQMETGGYNEDSFADCVQWFFETAGKGSLEYPMFFSLHAIGFANNEKEKGRLIMNQAFEHMKAGLSKVLKNDKMVREDAFYDDFKQEDFIEFVFYNIMNLLIKRENSCLMLLEIIKRTIY